MGFVFAIFKDGMLYSEFVVVRGDLWAVAAERNEIIDFERFL